MLGVDAAADAVREARQLIFDAQALRELESAAEGDERAGISGSAAPAALEDLGNSSEVTVRVPWNLAFRARLIGVGAQTLGHIHIRTFNVGDADGFMQEFVRLLGRMPDSGLILDVRGNGGGSIWAAERLLQTLTAASVEPERMQFIATPGTRDLCRHNDGNPHIPLGPWRAPLEEAVETGSVYSRGFSVTPADSCNGVGQKYYGPALLLVDGNCYSATNMFAAGFQDHGIGSVLGVAAATGAGGANVWDHGLLTRQLPPGWGLVPLPAGAGMRVALRQSLRVGPRAGALLEDYGVAPDRVHLPTRSDLLGGERELFAVAAEMLAGQALRSIVVKPLAPDAGTPATPTTRNLHIETRGLARLDFYIDERPWASPDLEAGADHRATLQVPVKTGAALRLLGYVRPADAQAAASWRGRV